MASVPDPTQVLTDLVVDANAKLDKILSTLAASPIPGPSSPSGEVEFAARWKEVTPDEFRTKYGVEYGQPLPRMTAFDEAEIIFRARCYYLPVEGTPGSRFTAHHAEVQDAVAKIAATNDPTIYEQGNCNPDVAACGFYIGLFAFHSEVGPSLGAAITPSRYKGATLQSLFAPNFRSGGPSGGK